MEPLAKHPHEARVQRYAYATLIAASALAAWDAAASNGKIFDTEIPVYARFGLVAAGAITGLVAASRRSAPVGAASAALILLGVIPGGSLAPGLMGYARGFLLGGMLLAFLELVHMTQRYDRAHKLVEEEGASEEGLDRVTDEALKTLGGRAAAGIGLAFVAVLLALGFAAFGPTSWREAVETASPLGVGVFVIGILGSLTLYILARGAKLRGEAPLASSEVAADVPE